MRNPIRLLGILLLSLQTVAAHAQKILVAGVKRAVHCEFATKPLIADLHVVRYPHDWTIIVACNDIVWQRLQRKADAQLTNTAFTYIHEGITVLNGLMYLQMPYGTAHPTPRQVLKHELGHIICGCGNEARADRSGEYTEPGLR